MDVAALLIEIYGRIPPLAQEAVGGLDATELRESPAPGTNSIGWLVWHLTRVQDDHVADILDVDQIWTGGNWAGGFGLAPDPHNTGYGHSPDEVAAVRPQSPDVLIGYLNVVDQRTRSMLEGLSAADLDRIVDTAWDPPVTLGVRLVSVADDGLQHAGQALYLRGLFAGRG